MDPKAKKEFVADFDYEFDEKHKTVSVTERGVEKAERFLGIDHLYRAENGPLVNHLIQSLKAESLYKRDVDYAVVDGEVKIIDEFTGRILDGRRWSEGLHQAVEAKEGVRVQEENQTLATITLQNYFRMYDKLAGMTGTALTEATEFMKIYKLPRRRDPDQPADGPRRTATTRSSRPRTASGRAVAREIEERHDNGPAGARRHDLRRGLRAARRAQLDKRGIPHTVLNAKPEHAEREGEIIAEAGRARRGHDRHQHGRPRRRHQARRQRRAPHAARARQARPAARRPGLRRALRRRPADASRRASRRTASRCSRPAACSSAAPSATSRAGSTTSCAAAPAARATRASRASSCPPRTTSCACSPATASTASSTASAPSSDEGEEEPIEAKMLSKQIENAQRKVEEQNFLIRKRVLEYDDVMNQQREIVYRYRDEVLEGRDMGRRRARADRRGRSSGLVDEYTPGDYIEEWDLDELWAQLDQIFQVDFGPDELDREAIDRDGAQAAARRGRA